MAILALLSLKFNSIVLSNNSVEIENKIYLTAFSLADDLIEEIKQKAFDEKTIDFQAIAAHQLTPAGSLGKDGETWPHFDDIDDYNGYPRDINLPHAEGYSLLCQVNYVDEDGKDSGTQTFFKKVKVTVSSDFLTYPVSLSFIFSLHSKN